MIKRRCDDKINGGITTIVLLACMLVFHPVSRGAGIVNMPALIPMPQKIVWNGQKFKTGTNDKWLVQRMINKLPGVPANENEAYSLKISADSAVLTATSRMGLFRGLQTVKQLTFEENGVNYAAGCSILDWPAFRIRGFMQDAGRNYMPVRMLKEQIDVMATYKYNTFHFHFTDNPGWRLESKKYPELRASSSMSRWPGKYYSQQEFLDIIDYCGERYITVIPEFDIPGHCEAFRKAFALDSMGDPRVKPILLDLIDELCSLVPADKMPYIHLGTDEVWHKHERPAPGLLSALIQRVKAHGREVIVWRPGQQIDDDHTSITQLWSSGGKPKAGHPYLDSRLNYLNHLDPLAGIAQLYFDRICNREHGDSLALGGILCCWNDNNVTDPGNILVQNPVYPGLVTYSETSWKGQKVDFGEKYLARFPSEDSPLYDQFKEFESRLISHRDRWFKGKPFPYVRQSEIEWSIIGPFGNNGDASKAFPVEEGLKKDYSFENKDYSWTGPFYGGTIHLKHFFGFPSWFSERTGTVYAATNIWSPEDQSVGCWIGFHDWSRSGGRRGGPFPGQGQWLSTDPKVWLNGKLIAPPDWQNPGLTEKSEEIPFVDENYFFREPSKIELKKGWNQVLLKVPQNGKSWKWMFTFVPVISENGQVKEVAGLKYSTNPQLVPGKFKLAPAFGEHMVIQHDKPVVLFGTANRNDQIEVRFAQHSGVCKAGADGNWEVELPLVQSGGPYRLKIVVNGQTVTDWKDILAGEVWFCSGQSNMAFRLDQSADGRKEAASASDDQLRLMNYSPIASTSDEIWDATVLQKINHFQYFDGSWAKSNPAEAAGFSAIAWHFGKELREKLKVPVGLVQVAAGGAPAESFIDRLTIAAHPLLANILPDWYSNDLVMEWCRERAMKNTSLEDPLLQRHPFMPSYIFEAGISAFKGFPVKGVIWYQGESNAHNPEYYEIVFPALVSYWRQFLENPELPFIYAQLSSIQRPGWEVFRDCQRKMALQIPNTGMVVTSDLGDSLNVHPIHKKEVGHRFALQALQKVYGTDVVADGPIPERVEIINGLLRITFNGQHLDTSDSKPLRELEIAGNDGVFRQVSGKLSENKIIVQTNNQDITQVRYAWKPFSRGNLINREGLPASTFILSVN